MSRNRTRAESGLRDLSDAQRADPLFVQSVERAMTVLSSFHHADGPMSLSEVAKTAGIDRSAAQRMVHTLRTLGYVQRDAGGHGFLPGIRLLDHTLDTLRLDPLVRRATPVLQELRKATRERVDLSLFDDLRVLYAVRLQTKRQMFYTTLVGHSVPTFCSSGGWAILSKLPDPQVADILARSDKRPFTPETITDPTALMAEVQKARQAGYAIACNQILSGEIAAGFPVMDTHGNPIAAIHIAGSLSEWSDADYAQRVVPLGQEAARAISQY
ncbi:Transcriptional regulator [Sulfitobacter noctilucae]|uniref:IclR family transcriptional regulator n=1 Tax=Sulfitobacter noctilucae TaxID=1342302 RepID=UPI000468EEF5|nr:IclR family transcriptional regulator [Sulfitobacter noctilucae]KIN60511.1 Transcriptional regulator [Sulfitobacter noctilucae]